MNSCPSTDRAILPLTDGHREGVLELFEQVFGRGKANALRRRFDWQYAAAPARIEDQATNWVFVCGGRVVGHLGAVMVQLDIAGEPHQGCWGIDLMVHPDHRQGKKFLELIRTLDRCCAVPMGYGMADQVGRIYERRGYVRHAIGSHLIRLTTVAGALGLANRLEAGDRPPGRVRAALEWKITNLRRLARRAPRARAAIIAGTSSELRENPPPDIDELWRRVAPGYPVAVPRNGQQLLWRYSRIQDPARFLCLRLADRLEAVAVLESFLWSGIRVLQISDLVVARERFSELLPPMLHHIAPVARLQGAQALLCDGFPSDLRACFVDQGFSEVVPGRRESHVVLNRDGRLPAGVIEPVDNWLLTAGDSDRSTPYPRLEWRD